MNPLDRFLSAARMEEPVDYIESIKEIDTNFIVPAPELGIGIDPEYITGLYKNSEDEMITFLDVDKLLNIDEL